MKPAPLRFNIQCSGGREGLALFLGQPCGLPASFNMAGELWVCPRSYIARGEHSSTQKSPSPRFDNRAQLNDAIAFSGDGSVAIRPPPSCSGFQRRSTKFFKRLAISDAGC